ncbi:MAG: prepilin peptidase [Planctomycetaceae bacterium]
MVGSFLNVVAHRVPRGETVVHGRSRCPSCAVTIRARDNVPVLGWLALRGRCRACGAAISPRYPLVEAACGGIATALALAEIALAPTGDPSAAMIAWAGRTALALTLVAWALLAERGHVVSGVTVGVASAAAALAAAFVPPLWPLPVGCPPAAWDASGDWPGHLVASAVGLAFGWAAGRAAGGGPVEAACVLVGAALGWQAAGLAALASGVGRWLGRSPLARGLAIVAVVLVWHPLTAAWWAMCRRWSGS